MGLFSAIFGGGGSSSDAEATTNTDVEVNPTTNVNNNITSNTVVDFTQAGQLISGSLDGFNDQVGQAGGAISEGLSKLGKTAAAISLIGLVGWSLK